MTDTPRTEAQLDAAARAAQVRAEHEATHEAEMCGAECIALGLAEFDSRSEEETGPMTDTPRTEAGRALLEWWKHDPKELATVEEVINAILAIEAEAANPDSGEAAALWDYALSIASEYHGPADERRRRFLAAMPDHVLVPRTDWEEFREEIARLERELQRCEEGPYG